MRKKSFSLIREAGPRKVDRHLSIDDSVRELKQMASSPSAYRERSLELFGLICAKCGREFDIKEKRLLTVHHKDGNHKNNPPDGSNWENLCVYCHDDEHYRGGYD